MLLKIIRFLFRAALLPLIPVLLLLHLVCALLLGMSSIVTHLLSEIFLVGAVAGWMTHARQDMVWQVVGIGAFFTAAPYIAEWLLGKLMDVTIRIIDFVFS